MTKHAALSHKQGVMLKHTLVTVGESSLSQRILIRAQSVHVQHQFYEVDLQDGVCARGRGIFPHMADAWEHANGAKSHVPPYD